MAHLNTINKQNFNENVIFLTPKQKQRISPKAVGRCGVFRVFKLAVFYNHFYIQVTCFIS